MTSLVAATVATQPNSNTWQLDPAASQLTVYVFKAGLFSGFLHDHTFVPRRWNVSAQFDPSHLQDFHAEVTVVTDSLRDTQTMLSAEDKAKVESQVVSPDVLDANRFPEIRFIADRVVSAQKADELEGTVSGKLSLHGVTRPLEVPVRIWRRGNAHVLLGKVSFKQSDFGIAPLRKAGGTIAVEDRVLVDFALRLLPSP
jgi:polyisoprenoid-binding protein YceI